MAEAKTPTRRKAAEKTTEAKEKTTPVKEVAKKEQETAKEAPKGPETLIVGLDQLEVNPDNPRHDFGNTKELGESILNNGLKQPLRVKRTGKTTKDGAEIFEIRDGHRRFNTMKALGKKVASWKVRVDVQPDDYPEKQEVYDLIAVNDGKTLTLLEQGLVFQKARELGDTDAEIARHAGKSQTHIADCLLLIDKASDKLIKDIKAGKISPTTVLEMLKEQSAEETEQDIDKAKEVAGDKKVTKKHISEATGKSRASKINSGASKTTKVVKDEPEANSETEAPAQEKAKPAEDHLNKLKTLYATIEEQPDNRKEGNFELLGKIINWLDGDIKAAQLASLFFEE